MAEVGADGGGGTFKAAYINRAGRPEVVLDGRGQRSMSSAVYIGDDGAVLVGQDAIEQGRAFPQNLAMDFKRHLGTGNPVLRNLTARDLTRHMFDAVKAQIEQQSGEAIDSVVLTRPANFKDEQTKDLAAAAEHAGLRVVAMITEPAAAAYGTAIRRQIGKRHVFICAVDLGSTTLDVSVLECKEGQATPVATEGVPQLGGSDLTRTMEELLLTKLGVKLGKAIARDKLTAEQKFELWERAEAAKIALSRQPSTRVTLAAGGRTFAVEITKQEYETAVKPLVERVLKCVDQALASSGKAASEFEAIVLAGAPMHSEFIRNCIDRHLGVACKVASDPSCCVAEGAALHAASLVTAGGLKGDRILPEHSLKLRESTTHDIGVVVIEHAGTDRARPVCAVLVPKGTPIPHAMPPQLFKLEHERQSSVQFHFVQGPDGTPATQCAPLGDASLSQLSPEGSRSARIQIDVSVSEMAVAAITITDNVSGKTAKAEIKVPSSGTKTP